jgi:hypothetical protein
LPRRWTVWAEHKKRAAGAAPSVPRGSPGPSAPLGQAQRGRNLAPRGGCAQGGCGILGA